MPRKRRKANIKDLNTKKATTGVRKDLQPSLNTSVDRILHPYFKKYPWLILVDGLIHGLIEYPETDKSIKKFIRYNGPKLLKELKKEIEKQNGK